MFSGGPAQTTSSTRCTRRLDPGHCLVAESAETGRLMGSCFYRARETHVSLGIMNVHPNHFGKGVAKDAARSHRRRSRTQHEAAPARLERHEPRLLLALHEGRLRAAAALPGPRCSTCRSRASACRSTALERVRDATLDDVEALAELELDVSGISRRKDYRYFIENEQGFWHVSVYESKKGRLDGYLASIGHPLFLEFGPGVARDEKAGAALLVSRARPPPRTHRRSSSCRWSAPSSSGLRTGWAVATRSCTRPRCAVTRSRSAA